MTLLDAHGRPVTLGAELARGGEGAVFDVADRPGSVAKLYLQPPDRDQADKVTAMVGMATDRLTALAAWPTATLHRPGGGVAGFLMPKLDGHRPVFQVYGPRLRLRQFPTADWRFLVHVAGNIARAFAAAHGSGLVVGDVNHANLFVAGNGIVRFVDADSMQVAQGARRWLCPVGVGTHQPPEMQGLANYRTVVRTPDHDRFGLAVLVFQVLCMGRHPFSGRFAGPGEPPDIERAITESRYAYSADRDRTLMSPPPGSLPMSALPAGIQALFEAAFAPGAARTGRPTAEQWAAELAALAASLRRCEANAAHWFSPGAPSCPWCEVEATSGVALFPAVLHPRRGGTGGFALLWHEIEALGEPGPMPELLLPDPAGVRPSPAALAAAATVRARVAGAAALLAVGVGLLAALQPTGWPVMALAVAGVAAALWQLGRRQPMAAVRQELGAARGQWAALAARWTPGPAARFAPLRRGLAAIKREWDGLPRQRETELRALSANQHAEQLRAHLESFAVASANIPGIGKAKIATLLSYGVETAADVTRPAVLAIPGFGPVLAGNLLAFRKRCEAAFRFDGSRMVTAAGIATLDGSLAQRRVKLEAELAAGLAQLRSILAAEARHRETLANTAAELRPRYAQALADARAVGADR